MNKPYEPNRRHVLHIGSLAAAVQLVPPWLPATAQALTPPDALAAWVTMGSSHAIVTRLAELRGGGWNEVGAVVLSPADNEPRRFLAQYAVREACAEASRALLRISAAHVWTVRPGECSLSAGLIRGPGIGQELPYRIYISC